MNSRSNRTDPSVAYKKNKNTLSIKAFLGCSSNLANIQMNVYCALECDSMGRLCDCTGSQMTECIYWFRYGTIRVPMIPFI
ncbi:hypothetical protein SDB07_11935, partial [Legionella pneumophila serogroup 1]